MDAICTPLYSPPVCILGERVTYRHRKLWIMAYVGSRTISDFVLAVIKWCTIDIGAN
ncbi:hypothetical protein PGT21_029334 [Puccinia graminis f. sp. tritici]|uniref:Uncharacterized protein n=1 Tax=Puccinia graminis f. sp. tritici TaxID=56615 RepID=A0A5B0QBT8_PUCGR|nr:hypothetical protein PGT21_029334 [Puccinia graminis f. sp. tritici]KAA1139264.1 hypothetical protein PGTUg99_037605 [Puccinia graminis f. sp. tritici]